MVIARNSGRCESSPLSRHNGIVPSFAESSAVADSGRDPLPKIAPAVGQMHVHTRKYACLNEDMLS
jgi:hypothetical protein